MNKEVAAVDHKCTCMACLHTFMRRRCPCAAEPQSLFAEPPRAGCPPFKEVRAHKDARAYVNVHVDACNLNPTAMIPHTKGAAEIPAGPKRHACRRAQGGGSGGSDPSPPALQQTARSARTCNVHTSIIK